MRADTFAAGLSATSSLPLADANGVIIGGVGFGWPDAQVFNIQQTLRLDLIAHIAARALERSYVYEDERTHAQAREREGARLFQEACIPRTLPDIDGLQLAAAYVPASDAAMGGDWYDMFLSTVAPALSSATSLVTACNRPR